MKNTIITINQLIDQASEFVLDPTGPFVLRKWNGKDGNFWVISDTWSYCQYLTMYGKWENRKDSQKWRNKVLWTEPLAAAVFYYGWRSRFYWVYGKGSGDSRWHWEIYTKSLEEAEKEYSSWQKSRPDLHWILVNPDRNIVREDVGKEKQEWIDYPLSK